MSAVERFAWDVQKWNIAACHMPPHASVDSLAVVALNNINRQLNSGYLQSEFTELHCGQCGEAQSDQRFVCATCATMALAISVQPHKLLLNVCLSV